MNIEEIWEQADWASQARNIITKLNQFPKDSKIILVLKDEVIKFCYFSYT